MASEEVTGCVWFRRDWLEGLGFDTRRCMLIGVRGGSMEPTLSDGCSILVDRSCTDLQLERIYVVRTDGALIVKRAGLTEDGGRLLVSDHPAWAPAPWPEDAVLAREPRWAA